MAEPVLPPLEFPEVPQGVPGLDAFQKEYDRILLKNQSYPLNAGINQANPKDPVAFNQSVADTLKSKEQFRDPYSYGKPVSFGAGFRDLNFDRYYNQSGFKKIGFSPFRDNEAIYNNSTSWLSDFSRAVPQIVKLTGLGFRDMLSEWGDWGNTPDKEHSDEMMKAMQMGSSTRGGVGGWITNFGVNLGYTLGITAEMAAEELGLTFATMATGFSDILYTAPVGASRAIRWAEKVKNLGRSGGDFKKAYETLKNIKSVEDAKNVMGLTALAGKTAKFINPLENLTEFAKGYGKLTDANIKNYIIAAKGAVALYRDARLINAVASESKLEGGTNLTDQTDYLVNQYYGKNGILPEGDDLDHIQNTASRSAFGTTMSNVPLIFLTDKIIFDTALAGAKVLKPGAKIAAEEITKGLGKRIVQDAESKAYKVVSGTSKEALKARFHPSRLLNGTLKYTGANFAQGIQENAQDMIQDTLKDYYRKEYQDPTLASLSYSMGRGIMGQMTGQGIDTFFSGFLMGGAIHGIQGPLINGLTGLSKKIFTPGKHQQWIDERDAHINNFTNILNDIVKNPGKYESAFNASDRNFTAQKVASSWGAQTNNTKTAVDAKDESAFSSAYWLLKNNHFSQLSDLIKDWKTLTPDQLTEAFNKEAHPDDTKLDIGQRLNNFEKKVNLVKDLYEQHFRDIPNPVDIQKAVKEQNKEAIDLYNNFEEYRKFALFNNYSYIRAQDRINSIHQKAVSDPVMSKISGGEFSSLYSPDDLKRNLDTLRAEISSIRGLGDPADKKDLENKQVRYNLLKAFRDNLNHLQSLLRERGTVEARQSKLKGPELLVPLDTHIARKNEDLYDSFRNYINHLTENEPVLDSHLQDVFNGIKDYYELKDDHVKLAKAANALNNPEHIAEIVGRWIPSVRNELDLDSVNLRGKALETFFNRGAVNELLNKLYERGILMELPDNIKDDSFEEVRKGLELIANGYYPSSFIDAASSKVIEPGSEKHKEALDIIKEWIRQTKRDPLQESGRLKDLSGLFEKKLVLTPDERNYVDEKDIQDGKVIPGAKLYSRVSDFKRKPGESDVMAKAAERGNLVDFLFRGFLKGSITDLAAEGKKYTTDNKFTTKYTDNFYVTLLESFKSIQKVLDDNQLEVVPDIPALWGDITGPVAGSIDILARNKKTGKYSIIDIKTSSGSRREDYRTGTYGYKYADEVQQNAYRELFKQRTGISPGIYILPLTATQKDGAYDEVKLSPDENGNYLIGVDATKDIFEILNRRKPPVTEELKGLDRFRGKIVWTIPGYGKTFLAKKNTDIIDGDDLTLELMKSYGKLMGIPSLEKYFKATSETFHEKNNPLSAYNFNVDLANSNPAEKEKLKDEFYARVATQMRDILKANPEKIILTGAERLIKHSDVVYLTSDRRILKTRFTTRPGDVLSRYLEEAKKARVPVITPETDETIPPVYFEEIVTGLTPSVIPADLQQEADQVTTLEELKTFEKRLSSLVREGKLTGDQLDTLLRDKRSKLIKTITLDSINIGDKVIMHDRTTFGIKGYATVVSKTGEGIKLKKGFGKSGKTVEIIYGPEDVELVYKEGTTQEDITPPIDDVTKAVSKTNVNTDATSKEDVDEETKRWEEQSGKSDNELNDEMDNDKDCK